MLHATAGGGGRLGLTQRRRRARHAVVWLATFCLPAAAEPAARPVWRAWESATFEVARREDKPVLLLVTAFGCHACAVLERETLAQPAAAQAVAARFVAVRVDADEQPHLADALSLAWHDLRQPPALPVLVALSSDGRRLAPAPLDDPRSLSAWLTTTVGADEPPTAAPPASLARGDDALARLAAIEVRVDLSDDALAPPALPALRGLVDALGVSTTPERTRALDHVLERAARSPVHDHIGGGFHRGRLAPAAGPLHYEKRLADNALWLRAFAHGYALTGNLLYRNMVQETVPWAVREMRDATGAFWATVDAASGGHDGAFYRFTPADVRAALGSDRTTEFLAQYDVGPPDLLSLRGSPFAGLSPSLDVLRARRARRVRPAPDERILAGANGLFIGALAASGQKLRRGSDLEAARRAADAVLARLGPAATLKHSTGAHAAAGPASLGDYAYLADGLLDLEAATGERRWRGAAVALVDAALMRLWDATVGGFRAGTTPFVPAFAPRSGRDTDLPAPNGVMASVLVRLGTLTGEVRYRRLARRTLEAFAAEAESDPRAATTLAVAAQAYLRAWPQEAAASAR